MTHYQLQQSLMAEIPRILKGVQLKGLDKKKTDENGLPKVIYKNIAGYEQQLPIKSENVDDISEFFPYYIVRLVGGQTKDDYDPWHDDVIIELGIFDDGEEKNGHRQIMTMVQKITDRFLARPLLDNAFTAEQDPKFEILDENTYLYYFAGIEIKFYVPRIGREDDFA